MHGSAGHVGREIFDDQGLKLLMIPRTVEYAIRAVVFLANSQGRAFPSHDIAEDTDVPPGYMSKVMHALAKADLVSSQRGTGGGYILTADPNRLTLLDVLIAMDPSFKRMSGSEIQTRITSEQEPLTLRIKLGRAVGQLFAVLGTTTIADVVRENGSRETDGSDIDAKSDGEGAD